MKNRRQIKPVAVLGLLLLIFGTNSFIKTSGNQNWPTCEGTITSSEIYKEPGKTYGFPRIRYEYTINNTRYTSSQVNLSGFTADQTHDVVNYYTVGKKVPVYFNPKNETIAVLNPNSGASAGTYMLFIAGVFFLIIGIRKSEPVN